MRIVVVGLMVAIFIVVSWFCFFLSRIWGITWVVSATAGLIGGLSVFVFQAVTGDAAWRAWTQRDAMLCVSVAGVVFLLVELMIAPTIVSLHSMRRAQQASGDVIRSGLNETRY